MSSEKDAWRIIHIPGRPPVPPDQQLTVNMVAAQIEQPKLTNTIIRRLSQIAPLEDLHHVKRVKKKCLEGGLQICCVIKGRVGRTVQAMAHLIPSTNLVVNAATIVDPLSNQVIARACDEVCSWHTPETEVDAECSSSTKSAADMTGWIKQELCLQCCSSGGLEQVETSISCLHPRAWIDERTRRSSSFWHLLRHVAIVAIESSAARDRRLFPDVRYEYEATKEERILSPAKSQAKRRKTDVADVDKDDKQDDAYGKGDLSSRPYLCTGNDIYLVWEPCTMCAMALVHQRIRRVFYAFPNLSAGALGSVHRLQGEKRLNHHYAVFRVVVPHDILVKAKPSISGS